jgi:hypothetical protein
MLQAPVENNPVINSEYIWTDTNLHHILDFYRWSSIIINSSPEKKTFSRTSWQISLKNGTIDPWVKTITNSSNKGPDPLQRGDNHKSAKMERGHWKSFSSRTTWPWKLRFTWKLPDKVQIQSCTNHGPRRFGEATIGKTIFTYVYIKRKKI